MKDVFHKGGNTMLKVGDTVKVISDTVTHWDTSERMEYIPIGTICTIRDIDYCTDGRIFYGIKPLESNCIFYYLETDLEKGHIEWIKE